MKCRRTYNMSKAEKEAFEREINRQICEWTKEHRLDIDKLVLYTLHQFGWGKERLKRFYWKFYNIEDELLEAYDNISSSEFLADISLNDIDVNVEKWAEELKKEEEIQ